MPSSERLGASTTSPAQETELPRREGQRSEAVFLLIAEFVFEILQRDLDRKDCPPSRIEPCLDAFEPRHRRSRHRIRTVRLQIARRLGESLLHVAERAALLRGRLH